jgi:hypothetical protein
MSPNLMQLLAGITHSPVPPVGPVLLKPTAPVESRVAPASVLCRKLPQRLLTRSRGTALEDDTAKPNAFSSVSC